MIRIVSDSSTLYSPSQAREAGFAVSPLSVTIAGKSYRELVSRRRSRRRLFAEYHCVDEINYRL